MTQSQNPRALQFLGMGGDLGRRAVARREDRNTDGRGDESILIARSLPPTYEDAIIRLGARAREREDGAAVRCAF
ncbi:MAG: hypothetical protein ACJ8CR_29410 [Roseiflexaceae bacterium]